MVRGTLLRTLLSTARKTPTTSTKPYFNPHIFPLPRTFSSSAAAASASASAAGNYNSSLDPSRLRNVAVIAHVDHGKTTLMDRLLRQCGADIPHERAMDSISLERERGITIASKVFFFNWGSIFQFWIGYIDIGIQIKANYWLLFYFYGMVYSLNGFVFI